MTDKPDWYDEKQKGRAAEREKLERALAGDAAPQPSTPSPQKRKVKNPWGGKGHYAPKIDALLKEGTLTDKQIAQQLGCHFNTVANRRRKMSDAGVIPLLINKKQQVRIAQRNTGDKKKPGARADLSELLAYLKGDQATDLDVLSDEQMEKILSLLILTGSDATKTAAVKQLADLKSKNKPKENLGPGPPLTVPEQIDRVVAIFSCCGEHVAGKAWLRAFGEENAPRVIQAEELEFSP